MFGPSFFLQQLAKLGIGEEPYDWIEINESDLEEIVLGVLAPDGTPYENGLFTLLVSVPMNYPHAHPVVKFRTKIWHPLVEYETGKLCQDYFKDQWSPANSIQLFLELLQHFFHVTQYETSVNYEAASQIQKKDGSFEKYAKEVTKRYALD